MISFVLVDDDAYALRGLSQYFLQNWQDYKVVGAFTDADDALAFMRSHTVDVVITDIQMPGITGLELIQMIRSGNPNMPIIALSAYDNYGYIRQALLGGAIDYLLKPYDLDMLNSAVNRAARAVLSLRNDLVIHERNDQLKRYRKTPHRAQPPEELLQPFMLGTFRMTSVPTEKTAASAVLDLQSLLPMDAFSVPCDGYTLLAVPQFKPDEAWLSRLDTFLDYYRKNHSMTAWFAYITDCEIHDLVFSEKLCQEMLRFLSFNQFGFVLDSKSYHQDIIDQKNLSIQEYILTQELIRLILAHNPAELEVYIDRAWNQMCSQYAFFQPDHIRGEVIRLCIGLEVELRRYFEKLVIESPENSISVSMFISRAPDITSLKKRLIQIVSSIDVSSQDGKTLPDYILLTVAFIEENYMRPITLKEAAQHAYINNWYLSTQFNKIMKISLTEYINKVRINHAIKLLSDPDAKIYQVSSAVGFTDPSYFSTVFKRFFNMTPREYQKQFSPNGGDDD